MAKFPLEQRAFSRVVGRVCLGALLLCAAPVAVGQDPAQEVERLRLQLGQPGADGREAREAAIAGLLAMPQPSAHRVLQQALLRKEDPEGLREAILQAWQNHLLNPATNQYGKATAEARREILTGYLAALAPLWPNGIADADLPLAPLGPMARKALQRVHAREIEEALRGLLPAVDLPTRLAMLRCVADLQQVALAPLLAEFLESTEPEVAQAARRALRLLTFHEEDFSSKASFAAWFERNGQARYLDLAERAAREADRRLQRARDEQKRIRMEASLEFLRAHLQRRPGVDWNLLQTRTLVDDPALLDACLELLQQSLVAGLPADDAPIARQAFARALLQRWRVIGPEQVRRRSLLLEVAAGLTRVEEVELATEIATQLFTQLEVGGPDEQAAALRGLRRFPTVDARTRVVRFALSRLSLDPLPLPVLETAVATLSSRTAPRWSAPSDNDPDRADWLDLVRRLGTTPGLQPLRDATLQLALTLDAREQRVGAVFGLLLDLARDSRLETRLRTSCLIHLQGWRDQSSQTEEWVVGMQQLLEDPEPQVRQLAVESLARTVDLVDPRRNQWLGSTISLLREHLPREASPAVLQAMAETLQVCGREPQMAERAIGAVNLVLGEIGSPPPAEHMFRIEPLLGALATIAADARAERGQWLGACPALLQFEKRQSLRLVLQNHAAVELAGAVTSADNSLAVRAREAMYWVIRTALLKSPREPWAATEELQREAREVRTAFTALDALEENLRLDQPQHRLLRLEVELVGGRFAEVIKMATVMLAQGGNGSPRALTAVQRERLQCLLGEALLAQGKGKEAARVFAEADPVTEPRSSDLLARIARNITAAEPVLAIELLARALQATTAEEPLFRARLLEWAEARLAQAPEARSDIANRLQPYAALFEAQDCPPEQRAAFTKLTEAR
jgi:hypothetical protein